MMPAVQQAHADRRPGEPDDDRSQHHVADETPDHRRDGRQEFDEHLERFPHPAAGKLGNVNRRPQSQRHRHEHRQAGYRKGAQEQGQDAVVRRFGRRPPLRAGEELREVQLAREHRQALAKDEEENTEHQQDRAPAAEPDQPFDGRFRAIQNDLEQPVQPDPQAGAPPMLARTPACWLIIHGLQTAGWAEFFESRQG